MHTHDLELAVETKAAEMGLVAHKPWLDKCMQLYSVSQVFQGIIVAGPPGSGKSSIVQTLVDALCNSPRGMSRDSSCSHSSSMAETSHKLQKIYPLAVDDFSLIFGHLNQNNDWVDGIFTSAWRKASRVCVAGIWPQSKCYMGVCPLLWYCQLLPALCILMVDSLCFRTRVQHGCAWMDRWLATGLITSPVHWITARFVCQAAPFLHPGPRRRGWQSKW